MGARFREEDGQMRKLIVGVMLGGLLLVASPKSYGAIFVYDHARENERYAPPHWHADADGRIHNKNWSEYRNGNARAIEIAPIGK